MMLCPCNFERSCYHGYSSSILTPIFLPGSSSGERRERPCRGCASVGTSRGARQHPQCTVYGCSCPSRDGTTPRRWGCRLAGEGNDKGLVLSVVRVSGSTFPLLALSMLPEQCSPLDECEKQRVRCVFRGSRLILKPGDLVLFGARSTDKTHQPVCGDRRRRGQSSVDSWSTVMSQIH